MESKLFLIVEDHPQMAENIDRSLKLLEPSAHCTIASNPEQAKERLKLQKFALITVDLMYGKTVAKQSAQVGLDLITYIFENYPNLSILVHSSDPDALKPIIPQAYNHQGGFVVSDKQSTPKEFRTQAHLLIDNPTIKLIPAELNSQGLKKENTIDISEPEKEILNLLCNDCLTNSMMAKKLNKSPRAIQYLMENVRKKLGIYNNKSEYDLRMLTCKIAKDKGLL